MDHLIGRLNFKNCFPTSSHMTTAYKFTHGGSKLRLFISRCAALVVLNYAEDQAGSAWNRGNIQRAIDGCNDLGGDALGVLRLHALRFFEDPRTRPACDYHQHAPTEPCPYARQQRRIRTRNSSVKGKYSLHSNLLWVIVKRK
jgi:hypothetical protein